MIKGNFIDNLPKIYGIYTGGFIAFIIIMAIGESMGMSAKAIGIAFVGFTIFIYALIGWLSRTAQASNYYVAGRSVPKRKIPIENIAQSANVIISKPLVFSQCCAFFAMYTSLF